VKHWQKAIKVGIAPAMDGLWMDGSTQSHTDTFSFSFGLSELGLQWRNQKDWLPYKANLPELPF